MKDLVRNPSPTFSASVLIVDDCELGRGRLSMICRESKRKQNLRILTATSIGEALTLLSREVIDAMVLDKNLSLDQDGIAFNGIEAIPRFLELQPHLQIVVLTASNDTQDAARAVSLGAYWFLNKMSSDELIAAQIDKAMDVGQLALEKIQRSRQQQKSPVDMAGSSVSIKLLKSRLKAVAETNRPVLLLGETGTGKTTAARLIHEHRSMARPSSPFFSVNLGAISSELAERELFGNERGAYTDAKDARPGLFELANGGTLFLDEIGEAPLELQVKLLKVIEDGKFMRLGGTHVRETSLKLICATNRNLEQKVAAGEFREDLYFRISTFAITIPPLSERREDIREIIQAVLPRCCQDNNVHILYEDLPEDFVDYLIHTPLRGNIREIEQHLSRLLVYAPKDRRGRPEFRQWKVILGLQQEHPIETQASRATLTLKDFSILPYNVLGPDFPGLDSFVDMVTDRVVESAMEKYKTLKELSGVLGVSITRLSGARRRILNIRAGNQRYPRDQRGSLQ